VKDKLLKCATMSDRAYKTLSDRGPYSLSSHLPNKGITQRFSAWRFRSSHLGVASSNQGCEVRLYLDTAKAEFYLVESRSRNDNEVGVPVVHHAMPKVAKRRPRHEQ
jgi:hypothetical protein